MSWNRRLLGFAAATLLVLLAAAAPATAQSEWSAATTVSPPDQYVETPVVSADQQGDAAVVWSRRIDPYNSSVDVVVRHGYGPFSSAQMISDGQPGQNTEPSVAVGPNGTVVVVWSQNTQSGDLIRVSFGSTSGGAFTVPATIEGPEPGQGVHNPEVSVDSSGGVLVVWAPLDGSIHYVSRAPEASSFGGVGLVANPGGSIMFYPTFGFAPNGEAVAAWTDYSHIYAATRPAGGSFGPAQTVESASCVQGLVHAAINSLGDSMIDWTPPTALVTAASPRRGSRGPTAPPARPSDPCRRSLKCRAGVSRVGWPSARRGWPPWPASGT